MAEPTLSIFGFVPSREDPEETSRAHILSDAPDEDPGIITRLLTPWPQRRRMLGLLLCGAVAGGGAVALSPDPGPDPVFVAIAQHEAAMDRFSKALRISGPMLPNAPGALKAEIATREAYRAEKAEWHRLLGVAPATAEGLRAYAAHLRWSVAQDGLDDDEHAASHRAFFALCDAVSAVVSTGGL